MNSVLIIDDDKKLCALMKKCVEQENLSAVVAHGGLEGRYTGIHVLVIYACVQLADLIKCVIGFVLVKKGVWLQNIVSS